MQNTSTARARKRKPFSSERLQDPQLWRRTSWLQSFYTEDKNAFVPVQEYCDAFIAHQGLNCGYRDMWNILKLAFPKVEKIRRGRKYVYWGIRRSGERAEKRSRKQAKGGKTAAESRETKAGVSTRRTGQSDVSVEHEHPRLEENVSFNVHLGTSRVEVAAKPRDSTISSETPTENPPAGPVMVTLPGNKPHSFQDGSSADFDAAEPGSACTVTMTDVSVQTSSLAESGACAEEVASHKSVEVRPSTVSSCPHGVRVERSDGLAGFRVKQEPLWDSEVERPTFLNAAGVVPSSSNVAEDAPRPAFVPFPANNPPSGSSIDCLKQCINRIPQVSQISGYTILSDPLLSRIEAQSNSRETSTGQSPGPRPVQVSVGTQHKACSKAVRFPSGNLCKKVVDLDKRSQENHFNVGNGAFHRIVLARPGQPSVPMNSGDFQPNGRQNEATSNLLRSSSASPMSKDVSMGTSTKETGSRDHVFSDYVSTDHVSGDHMPVDDVTSDHVSNGKSLLPVIVSVMSYGVPETNATSGVAHVQANHAPPLTSHREQPLSNESRLRSEIQHLRDELLEERRFRRTVETQLKKCMSQLRCQSEQLAEAFKPIYKK